MKGSLIDTSFVKVVAARSSMCFAWVTFKAWNMWGICRSIVQEASMEDLLPLWLSTTSELFRALSLDRSTSFLEPVQRILRYIVESQGNLQRPAELIFQLSNLEDTIVGCLSFCSDQDIGTLLRLASVNISRWSPSSVQISSTRWPTTHRRRHGCRKYRGQRCVQHIRCGVAAVEDGAHLH